MTERVLTFSEGMFENANDLLLSDTQALFIENMKFNGNNLENIPDLIEYASLTGVDRAYKWRSANKISAANSNENYVCLDGVTLKIFYPTSGGYMAHSTTFTLTSAADFFYDSSPEQFVFVDGKEGHNANRIVIDDLGVLSILNIGVDNPDYPASLTMVLMDTISAELGSGTGLPSGVNIQYIHTDLNEYGEESNPSPILSISNACLLSRGEVNDAVSEVDDLLKGEVISTEMTVPLSYNVAKKRLYRRWCPYSESNVPFTDFALVNDYTFAKNESLISEPTVIMIDSFEDKPFTASYDNNIASSADDIILFDNTIVLGNTKKEIQFPEEPTLAWEIILTNNNSLNYIDSVVSIDLLDSVIKNLSGVTSSDYVDLNFATIGSIEDKIGFCDSDMTTILPALSYGLDSINTYYSDSVVTARRNRLRVDIKIPYIAAGQSKTIYFLYFSAGTVDTIFEDSVINASDLRNATYNYIESDYCYDYIKPLSADNHICYSCRDDAKIPAITPIINNANNNLNPDYPATNYFTEIDNLDVVLYNPYGDANSPFFIVDTNSKFLNIAVGYTGFTAPHNNIVIDDKVSLSFYLRLLSINAMVVDVEYNLFQFTVDQNDDVLVAKMKRVTGSPNTVEIVLYKAAGSTYTEQERLEVVSNLDASTKDYSFFINLSLENKVLDKVSVDNSIINYSLQVITFEKTLATNASEGYHFSAYGEVTAYGFYDKTLSLYFFKAATFETYISQLSVVLNKYYDASTAYGKQRFLALASHWPDYPVSAMGTYHNIAAYWVYVNGGTTYNYQKNANIQFKSLVLTTSKYKEGYLVFGSEYIPALNEINLNENIIRIVKMPSFTADSDINTILAFCEDNIYRVYISKDTASYQIASEIQQSTLLTSRSLAVTDRNVYFMSYDGLMQYGKDGIKNLSKFKVSTPTSYPILSYSSKDRILRCYNDDYQLWYLIDYDSFMYSTYAVEFVGEMHDKKTMYILENKTYIDHSTNKLDGRIITGKVNARNKLRTLYTTKDVSATINIFSAKVGTQTSVPYYILYLNGTRSVSFGSGVTGSLIDAKNQYLTKYLKYHPANVKCDYVNFELTIDKDEKAFEMLIVETGGK